MEEPRSAHDGGEATLAALGTGLRLFARTWAFAIAVAIPLATTDPMLIDLPVGAVWGIGTSMLVLHLVAAFLPWEELFLRPGGRLVVEAFPILATTVALSLALFAPWSPIYAVVLITAGGLGALYVRVPGIRFLTAAPVLGLSAVAVLRPESNPLLLLLAGASTVSITWATYEAGRTYRASLVAVTGRFDSERRHTTRLAALAEASRRIAQLEGRQVLQAVADAAPALGWDVAMVRRVTAPTAPVDVEAHVGIPDELAALAPPLGLVDEATHTRRTVVADVLRRSPGVDDRWLPFLGSAMAAPIVVEDRLIGVLVVGSRRVRRASGHDVHALELLAGIAARALEVADEYEEHERQRRELEHLSQLRQEFLGTVSHELRTPLAVVLGMAETIDVHWEELGEDRRHDLASRMHESASGLHRVIESLLDYSRLEAGMVEPHPQPVAVADLARSVVKRLETLRRDHRVQVVEVTADLRAMADPLLIERVLENLLTNAARHTPAGTTVQVVVDARPGAVLVEVNDDGPGIPAEHLARLGERFYRGAARPTRSSRGLGLGLAFCRQILEMHDSELRVTSSVGVGTTFSFVLPLATIGAAAR